MHSASTVLQLLKDNKDFVERNGIPRQQKIYSDAQSMTSDAFAFKWKQRDTYESQHFKDAIHEWLLDNYSLDGLRLSDLLENKIVFDAGCGSGYSAILLFGDILKKCRYIGMDISDAVEIAAKRFAEHSLPGEFIQASILDIPEEIGNFDVVFSEGVLHHTDSTEKAIKYLASRINPQGFFMFYVYRKKGPIREFTDDYVREKLAGLSDEEAWKQLRAITLLGKKLGELNIEFDIDEPIDVLDIPAGPINLQRLFYWHIFKCYYRPDWSIEEMNHVNFDWFRPQNCHRQSPEEVQRWVREAGLSILKMHVKEAGISIVAKKE